MNILGINCYGHDTGAALLVDGRIAYFSEEERFNRIKHTREYPYSAIVACRTAMKKKKLGNIASICYPFRIDDELLNELQQEMETADPKTSIYEYNRRNILDLRQKVEIVRRYEPTAPFCFIGHHESHLASTFFSSPFERAAILSIDGSGDLLSTMFGIGEGTHIRKLKAIRLPHSLGYVYSSFTQYLGFQRLSDEGKVMGLAPYGKPTYRREFEQFIRLTADGGIELDLNYFWHHEDLARINPRMVELLGPFRRKQDPLEDRHADIAFCLQERTEQAFFHLLRHLHAMTGCDDLCLAGGVTLNSCANGKILENTPFKRIFIPPFVHDAGTAIGAAQWQYHHVLGKPRHSHRNLAYLGYAPSDDEIEQRLKSFLLPRQSVIDPGATAARLIADGHIIGWYQNRTEAGPRALGNRSILADPRDPGMKDKLNSQVKFREGFRPYAPAVLVERLSEYFDLDTPEPYMLRVRAIREEKRKIIPAVTHVDGTGRLQTVSREDNPSFYHLLEEFDRLTGVPIVINTSFNVMGEPIVNKPEDAIRCFYTSGLEALILGRYLLVKSPELLDSLHRAGLVEMEP